MTTNYFHKMIGYLREKEEIMLYGNILNVSAEEQKEVTTFLQKEYETEALDFPFIVPPFNSAAALWAAETIYLAAQLMLYRENKDSDLEKLLPPYNGELNASAILSADVCLRFLPAVLVKLKLIDAEDKLITILETHLKTWHYSGINYPLDLNEIDLTITGTNNCLRQLYVNRVIENKKLELANHPALKEIVLSNLGLFAEHFWKDFKTTSILYEQ